MAAMVIFVYSLTKKGKDIAVDGGGDLNGGTDEEIRLGQCMSWAVQAAMTEVLKHRKEGCLIERKMVEEKAEEAVRAFLRSRPQG